MDLYFHEFKLFSDVPTSLQMNFLNNFFPFIVVKNSSHQHNMGIYTFMPSLKLLFPEMLFVYSVNFSIFFLCHHSGLTFSGRGTDRYIDR